jgi:hypothetical protein
LWAFVLLIHFPIISFDMMYCEQPVLYLLNQKITSLHDLLQVYLHPAMLDVLSIPFFRPSGHFLVYQIITSFLDWHNTKGFLVVNFFFLALTGFMIIKLYALLFPRQKMGGYIACALYLMHPALVLPKFTPMHFEFACLFFLLLALYCFVSFFQKNKTIFGTRKSSPVQSMWLVALSILFYFISVTFKEIAIMLGPVIVAYLLIAVYQQQRLSAYVMQVMRDQMVRQLVLLFTIVTVIFAVYLTMAWPTLSHPLLASNMAHSAPSVLSKLLQILFYLPSPAPDAATDPHLLWSTAVSTPLAQWLLRGLTGMLLVGGFMLYAKHAHELLIATYRKSFLFLGLAALAFIVLPVMWNHAMPWHLAASLVFVSLMMGFSCEYLARLAIKNSAWMNSLGAGFALLLGLTTITVSDAKIQSLNAIPDSFILQLNRNAVLHPPAIKNQLNADSVLVVEDSTVNNDYLLGDSIYPYELYGSVDIHRALPATGFYQYPSVYGGTLFRWAYLMPDLKEQVYPFQIDKMQTVSDVTVYGWLQHYDNIFCLGYDAKAGWHDRTARFKQNLLVEKIRRHLDVEHYNTVAAVMLTGKVSYELKTPIMDAMACQFVCDKTSVCKGFTYVQEKYRGRELGHCYFHDEVALGSKTACSGCESYIKILSSRAAPSAG